MNMFDAYLERSMAAVDWVPFSGPVCATRPGRYITHVGYAAVGPYLLKCYKLSDGEAVFDADSVEEAIDAGT